MRRKVGIPPRSLDGYVCALQFLVALQYLVVLQWYGLGSSLEFNGTD